MSGESIEVCQRVRNIKRKRKQRESCVVMIDTQPKSLISIDMPLGADLYAFVSDLHGLSLKEREKWVT